MIMFCLIASMIELFMLDLVMFMIYLFWNLIMQLLIIQQSPPPRSTSLSLTLPPSLPRSSLSPLHLSLTTPSLSPPSISLSLIGVSLGSGGGMRRPLRKGWQQQSMVGRRSVARHGS